MMTKTYTMTAEGRDLAVETLVDIALITSDSADLAKSLLMHGAAGFMHYSDTQLAQALLNHGCVLPEGTDEQDSPALSYVVTWRINVDDVASPTEAAHGARACQRPGTWATVFDVVAHDGTTTAVDLDPSTSEALMPQDVPQLQVG